jgi:acyl carrier protein
MNIREELQDIFRDVFFDDELVIFDEMTADDVEDWDSLSHLNLIAAIEKHFKIEFTTEEMLGAKNVGEFIGFIERKVG